MLIINLIIYCMLRIMVKTDPGMDDLEGATIHISLEFS